MIKIDEYVKVENGIRIWAWRSLDTVIERKTSELDPLAHFATFFGIDCIYNDYLEKLVLVRRGRNLSHF